MKYFSKTLAVIFSFLLSISCEKENIPPTCEITSPGNDAEYEVGDLITISVEAEDEDGTIEEVSFYIDDVGVGPATSFPFNYIWDTESEEDGIKRIKVSVKDDRGATVEDEISILLNPGPVTDIEGNVYNTVTIGTQEWMAENLKTTKFNDGTSIPLVTDGTEWGNLTTPGYCYYNNNETTNKNTYGALYNWYTINTDKLCPAGWHVPTDAEWTELENYLITNGYNYDGTTSEDKFGKSLASTSGWSSSSDVGAVGNDQASNNSTGFSAFPGGYRNYYGSFRDVGLYGTWWSSTSSTEACTILHAYSRDLHFNYNILRRFSNDERSGLSVRCLRD